MAPHAKVDVPEEQELLNTKSPPTLRLAGFRIRQETPYTDQKFTWMDLHALEGWTLSEREDVQVLVDVEVKLVTRQEGEGENALDALSQQTDVAWVMITAATGYYYQNRNIELEGDVQVFGYTLDGRVAEWLQTERLFYNCDLARVSSQAPAIYEGLSLFPGQPSQCYFDADVNLSEIKITDKVDLDPAETRTPFRDPSMIPEYAPPESLKLFGPTVESATGTTG